MTPLKTMLNNNQALLILIMSEIVSYQQIIFLISPLEEMMMMIMISKIMMKNKGRTKLNKNHSLFISGRLQKSQHKRLIQREVDQEKAEKKKLITYPKMA